MGQHKYKHTECGPSQFGSSGTLSRGHVHTCNNNSSRERFAAANAANVQYAGQQRVIIITRQPTMGSRTKISRVISKKAIVHIV